MKQVTRVMTFILAFVLLLTGCGADPAGSETTSGAAVPDGDWIWADAYNGTFSDRGYYYCDDTYLRYLDTESGLSTVLCSKVGCTHDQESCEARNTSVLMMLGGMCFWEENLYYLESSAFGADLYRCGAEGMGREKIGTLGKKYIDAQLSVTTCAFAQAGHYWYYSANAKGAVLNEETGIWTNKTVVTYISRIDLRTGKEDILTEDWENMLELYAAQENAVLYTTRGIPEADLRDPAYREQLKKLPVTLHCWDGASGEASVVFKKDGSNFGKIHVVVGDKLYYGLSEQKEDGGYTGSNYVFDLKTGSDTLFAENEAMQYLGGEYVKRMELGTEEWYIFGLESGKQMPVEVSSGYPRMECWTDRGCILFWQAELENGKKENRTGYVTYEAMADGLQDDDILVFGRSING